MKYNFFKLFSRRSRNKLNGNFEEVLQEIQFKNYSSKNILDKKFVQKLETSGLYFISLSLTVLFVFFLAQAYKLQITDHAIYKAKSNNNQFVDVAILPKRGRILDRNDVVLAETIKNESATATSPLDNNFTRKYADIGGSSHIVGYVKNPQKDNSGNYWQKNFEGVSGIEAYYDQLLAGRPGKRIFEKDSGHNLNASFVTELPIEGKDVKLSIDSKLNEYAQKTLADYVNVHKFQGGSAVIMDIETGEIIVMTNYPEYDVNKIMNEDRSERQEYLSKINKDTRTPLLNRAISGTYAPGSIMKTIFAMAALEMELIDTVTSIYSAGFIEVQSTIDANAKTVFRDWKAHGWVNVRTALANSSDVFFYAVGGGYEKQKGMGISNLVKYAKAFGVDSLTGIDLGGERAGVIPSPEWKKRVFKDDWRLGDTYITSIGQFGFLVSPLAATVMSAAIANNGYLVTPTLRMNNQPVNKKKVDVHISDEWYKVARDSMRLVVTNGTAKRLNSDLLKISGKSGTAEVGVKKDKIHSWISGYFPADNPKYAYTFLCELGIREVSPTPNLLARDVIETMYLTNEYYRKIEGRDRPSTSTSTDALDRLKTEDSATNSDITELISR